MFQLQQGTCSKNFNSNFKFRVTLTGTVLKKGTHTLLVHGKSATFTVSWALAKGGRRAMAAMNFHSLHDIANVLFNKHSYCESVPTLINNLSSLLRWLTVLVLCLSWRADGKIFSVAGKLQISAVFCPLQQS